MKPSKPIDKVIVTLRNQKVILDADLAEIYGVPTKALNQAVKRNADRFPEDFRFQLTLDEWDGMWPQTATTSPESVQNTEDNLNRSQIVTGSQASDTMRSQIVTASKRTCATSHLPSPSTARSRLPMSSRATAPQP